MAEDPQAPSEQRRAARHLVQRPLTVKEHDPDLFRLIRRHEADLDRWFTQRLGYRLHVGADTARLHKTGYVPVNRPLRTGTDRPLRQLEYVLLALILASTAAGPAVISLRDLIEQVRSAAAEADIPMGDAVADRRALVTALKWMIDHGLATELHAKVDTYATDEGADAVLRIRPDRIALLPLPALVGAATADELLERADRRSATRQWMRGRLVEDPVLYRSDLDEAEWAELRRRLGEEERILDEMFGLTLESRAEGVAAVDPAGTLADQRFPAGGTVGHAALLLLEALRPDPADDRAGTNTGSGQGSTTGARGSTTPDTSAGAPRSPLGNQPVVSMTEVRARLTELVDRHRRRWANHLIDAPDRLTNHVVRLLEDLRLAEEVVSTDPTGTVIGLRLLPAAGRFLTVTPDPADEPAPPQDALW